MAFSSATIWQVRTDGNSANGGGFDSSVGSPGTDYSNQAAAQITYTDMVIDGADSTKFTSAGNPVTSAHVGNVINVTSGTGFTVQRVVIVSQAAGVATCDKSLGTVASTGGNGKLGGAVALPSTLLGTTPVAVAGNTVYVRSGTYSLGATTETIGADGSIAGYIKIIGYPAAGSPTDTDVAEASMPVFTTATNSVAIFTGNGASFLMFRNIKVTHTAATRGKGWVGATAVNTKCIWVNCVADGCLNGWDLGTSSLVNWSTSTLIGCVARNCSGSSTTGAYHVGQTATTNNDTLFINCIANDNAGDGWQIGTTGASALSVTCINCIADTNARDGFRVAITTGTATRMRFQFVNCTAYNNVNGFKSTATTGDSPIIIQNSIIYGNTAYGISCDTAAANAPLFQFGNAFGGNATANRNVNTPAGYGDITLTGDPFTNAGSRDFSLNNTAGAGAACRGVGYPAKIGIYDATTATYLDVGAAQVQLTSSGGLLTHPGMSGGMRA